MVGAAAPLATYVNKELASGTLAYDSSPSYVFSPLL